MKVELFNNRVDELFAEWDKPDSPGCAIAIIKAGELIYKRGYGMADLEHDIVISPESIFDIGSTSKQFTAMCIALLVHQGKLSLEDTLHDYIPEMVKYEHPITIRHLVHHTSGIRDYISLMDLAGMRFENEYPLEEVIGLLSQQKELNFVPGEEFLYSNSGYLLLAEVVKRISGHSLREFSDEHIFTPLGMKSTHFHDDLSEIVKNRAIGYSPTQGGGYQIDMSISDLIGDGCLYTNVEDLFKWDQNFYNNTLGGFGQDLIEMVTTVGTLNNGELLNYAYGLFIDEYKGLSIIQHSGSWMGYVAEFSRFPQQRYSVICLSNLSNINPSRLTRQIADLYLSDVMNVLEKDSKKTETEIIEPSERDSETKTGIYICSKNGSVCELSLIDRKLTADLFGQSFQIVPESQNQYKSIDFPYDMNFTFGNTDAEKDNGIHIQFDDGSIYTYARIETEDLSPEQIQEYVGDYYCDELNTNYKIFLKDDVLQFNKKYYPPESLKYIANDLFFWTYLTFRFYRDGNNQIIGFSLGEERIKNLKFIKRINGQ